MKSYFQKMKGGELSPKRPPLSEILCSCLGIMISIGCIFYIDPFFRDITSGLPLLFASIGASAVLVFGAPDSPFSQPRNVIGGHFFSALSGVTAHYLFPEFDIFAVCFAVTGAGVLMFSTKTVHPPGGATALLATLGLYEYHSLGYLFVFTPCTSSAIILCFFGVLINNLSKNRKYPRFWW